MIDEVSLRSEQPGILFDSIHWDEEDERVLFDSEEKLLFASMLYSKIVTDEENAYIFFVAALHNYIEVLAEYNTHSRELSQMLFSLFDAIQKNEVQFKKIASVHYEVIENLALDLRRWREFMGSNAYSMEDIHKLHEPTMSAILQIVDLIDPSHPTHDDDDGMEFF